MMDRTSSPRSRRSRASRNAILPCPPAITTRIIRSLFVPPATRRLFQDTGMDKAEIDREVRLFVYRHFVDHGAPPDVAMTATALGYSRDETERSFRRLGEGHALVFTPGTVDIWMASPFCALPTTFDVTSERGRWWGTCVWDSFGIPAALDADATIKPLLFTPPLLLL